MAMIMDPDTKSNIKNYAVVKFLSDCTFSEIPTAWLSIENDMQQCWWPPRTANSATLIANCASPSTNTWSSHKVELIKYCSSLESARKSASDANYHTTDEERLGRGKRSHVPNNRYSSGEEGYEEIQSRKSKTKKKTLAEKYLYSSAIAMPPSCPEKFGLNVCNVSQKSYASCSKETSSQQGMENISSPKQIERGNFDLENIPIVFEEYVPYAEDIKENCNTKNNFQQLLRMQATANITLQDISQRLQKLEKIVTRGASTSIVNNDHLIARFLPLSTVERIKQFELLLKTTEEAVTQFKEYLLKTGGNNPKDSIQRSLKKIFTNECAMNCSMKGIRNNFRVGDLLILRIIRRELTSRFANLTESEFDNIVAEWLRFAKQRKERDDKTKERNEENVNNEEQRVQYNTQ